MNKVYINGSGSISTQKTFDNPTFLEDVAFYEDHVFPALEPNYKDFIPPAAARRMAKGIKMGVATSQIAIREAAPNQIDAIITGTGMGCVRDSEKFVSAILDNAEQFLTPTSFIQSTHNTVAGQIALGIDCKGYNFTYVHSSISFESALMDALMQLQAGEANHILLGGVDELGDHTTEIHRLIGHIKTEKINPAQLSDSNTEGTIFGEGANFFVLSNTQQPSSYAEVVDVRTFNTLPKSGLKHQLDQFLMDNGLSIGDLDVLITGHNGDVAFDHYYGELTHKDFVDTPQVYYKHLSGEFNTASAFGFWLGAQILKTQHIPKVASLNQKTAGAYRTILLYNQYRGEHHSFTLLRQC